MNRREKIAYESIEKQILLLLLSSFFVTILFLPCLAMLYPALPPACLPAGLPWSSTSTDPKNSKWYDLIDLVNSYALLFLAVLLRWLVRAVQRNVCLYSGPSRLHPPKVIFIDHFAFIYFLIAHWLTSDILFGTDDSFTSLHFHSCSNSGFLILHLLRRLQIRDAILSIRLSCGASLCFHDFIDHVRKVQNFLIASHDIMSLDCMK